MHPLRIYRSSILSTLLSRIGSLVVNSSLIALLFVSSTLISAPYIALPANPELAAPASQREREANELTSPYLARPPTLMPLEQILSPKLPATQQANDAAPSSVTLQSTQSDFDLTRELIGIAETELEELELLGEEYERFQELQELLSQKPNQRELTLALSKSARRIDSLLQRHQLRTRFTPAFIKQIDFYTKLHQGETTHL